MSSFDTSLVTDFNSISDGRTRDSSLRPKLCVNKAKWRTGSASGHLVSTHTPKPYTTDLWIRLFTDPSGALPNPFHAVFI
jgi:hypothetical protein